DDLDLGLDLLVLQQQRGPTDRKLADATAGKAAAEDETLRVPPFFQFEETLQHAASSCAKDSIALCTMPADTASPLASKSSGFFLASLAESSLPNGSWPMRRSGLRHSSTN